MKKRDNEEQEESERVSLKRRLWGTITQKQVEGLIQGNVQSIALLFSLHLHAFNNK